jgi:hypothetical protein
VRQATVAAMRGKIGDGAASSPECRRPVVGGGVDNRH